MRLLGIVLVLAIASAAHAQPERVVEIPSRGLKVRALLIEPENPVGSMVLLAGGHGILALSPDGRIGWGASNQLVRTRAAYAASGFVTLVPDAAPDMGTPDKPKSGFRWSAEHARDIGAVIAFARKLKEPVTLVGTSRAAVPAGALLAHGSGPARPDALVLTAAMLMPYGNQPSFVQAIGNRPERARLPFLVIGHMKDRCPSTVAASIEPFRDWHGGTIDVVILDGPEGQGDPCEAASAHGFAGIDRTVVTTVTEWVRTRK